MTREEIERALASHEGAWLDHPHGDKSAVYKYGGGPGGGPGKMFACIAQDKSPTWLSLKCDPDRGELLRDKYESVIPGYHLNKKHWITVICDGEVPDDEVLELIQHSYQLVRGR